MMGMYTRKILFYWRYALIIVLSLIALNTIPPILTGVAFGNKKALRDNISEAQKGEYILKGYQNANYTQSLITEDDAIKIDSILKDKIPEKYIGYVPILKGKANIIMAMEHNYIVWVEADSSIEDSDVAYLSSNFHPEADESGTRYRTNDISNFKDDLKFVREEFVVPISSNPFLTLDNSLFSYMPDVRVSFPVARKLLDYPSDGYSAINLVFSKSISFSEIEEILSESFHIWSYENNSGFAEGLFKNKKYNADTVLALVDLDNDLIQVSTNLIDNGQAAGIILGAEKTLRRAENLSRFFTVSFSVIMFLTMMMENEARRKEADLTISLGGTFFRVVRFAVTEKIILAFYSLLFSFLIIFVFSSLYRMMPFSDPIEMLFSRDGQRVFCFDIWHSLKLAITSIILIFVASFSSIIFTSRRK